MDGKGEKCIIHRKHLLVLLPQTKFPLAQAVAGLVLFVGCVATGALSVLPALLLLLPVVAMSGFQLYYRTVDWRNEMYVITEDELYTLVDTPLMRVKQVSCPLTAIDDTFWASTGFWKRLLRCGTVVARTAGKKVVELEDVWQPTKVRREIDAAVKEAKARSGSVEKPPAWLERDISEARTRFRA